MKYEVTGICGHIYTVNLIGPNKNREYRLERLKSECCPCCKEEIRKAEIERENNEAAEKSAEMELPELQGSPKQVAWANSIKIRMLNELSGLAEHVNKNYSEKRVLLISQGSVLRGLQMLIGADENPWGDYNIKKLYTFNR